MRIFSKLLPLFIIVPLVELALLIEIGRYLGAWETVALVVITGVLGAMLMQGESTRVWTDFQTELLQGKMPTDKIIEGVLVLIGGILLITPGVITDLLGLSLVFPISRILWRNFLKEKYSNKFTVSGFSSSGRQQAEVEVIEILDNKNDK